MTVQEALDKAAQVGMKPYIAIKVDTNDADYLTGIIELSDFRSVDMWQRYVDIMRGDPMTEEEEDDERFVTNLYDVIPTWEGCWDVDKLEAVREVEFYFK